MSQSKEKILSRLKKHIPRTVFVFFQPIYHFLLAFLAALVYRFPSRKLTVIGVTGTKGKTTVVELLHEVFKGSGYPVASLSSLRSRIGETETSNQQKMTMPGRLFVQKFLHDAVEAQCKYVILEVTSEGIKQFRHRFIDFDVAVMTNVHPEHIESHGGFENYLRAKLDLFWRLKRGATAVINAEDPHMARFTAATPAHRVLYSSKEILIGPKPWRVHNVELDESVHFEINHHEFSSHLPGEFNFLNIVASVATALSCHLDLPKIAEHIERVLGIPGRMEFLQREPFSIVVDYAHTPDSLRAVYTFLRNHYKLQTTNYKLICVLGAAGGGRDTWKRPIFGNIASELCDEIFLTNEDPYDESPSLILEDIEKGITTSYKKIVDREEAIKKAVALAGKGDVVVITGKGAESSIAEPGGKKIPWDDREVVKKIISQREVHPAHNLDR